MKDSHKLSPAKCTRSVIWIKFAVYFIERLNCVWNSQYIKYMPVQIQIIIEVIRMKCATKANALEPSNVTAMYFFLYLWAPLHP